MKISRDAMAYGHKIEFDSVQQATVDALIPNPYSYDGQLEKLKAENEQLRDVVSRLIECLYGESNYRFNKVEAVQYILGYGYEVEE